MPDADAKRTKHRKSTCAGCRRRKSKCDGRVPSCTTCIAYKDDCRYDKPPSLAYVRSLEEEVHELKAQLRQARSQTWTPNPHPIKEEKISIASPASDANVSQQSGSQSAPNRRRIWENDIIVDDRGKVAFNGPTSAVYEPPDNSALQPLNQQSVSSVTKDEEMKRNLVVNATQQREIEPYAIANGAVKVNIPKELSEELLRYHWCWIHPLFLFVYRPAFVRGMSSIDFNAPSRKDPPYFSDTLLKVMHAHCARFLNHDVYQHHYSTVTGQSPVTQTFSAHHFMQKLTEDARLSLGMDMLQPSAIPTIQALLQQSAREVVFGRSSQAWTFAGVAFRMALDMGIHLPSDRLQSFVKSLTAEDIEVRKRLFWACYTWDKILSVYLGRMPGFAHPTDDLPMTFMDDYSDKDPWAPYYGETPKPDHAHAPNYPPCPGYVVSTFQQNCRLCVILNDLMHNIYSPEAAARRESEDMSAEAKAANEQPFIRIAKDLQEFYVSMPPHLRINAERMPPLAPPVHIMSLNLLYHTTVILLHRPVVLGSRDMSAPGPSRSFQACLQATAAIHDLLILQSNTFGLSHVSYLNAYAAYIAATIAVLRFEREHTNTVDPAMSMERAGLTFLLEVLKRTASAMPALERSDAIIRKRVQAVIDRQSNIHRRPSQPSPVPVSTPLFVPTTHDMSLAQPTAFQTMSAHSHHNNNGIPTTTQQVAYSPQHILNPSPAPDTVVSTMSAQSNTNAFVAPMQWQSDMRSSLHQQQNPYQPQSSSPSPHLHSSQQNTNASSMHPPPHPPQSSHSHHRSNSNSLNSHHVNNNVFIDEDFLPAFPGQQFPVGISPADHGGFVDSQARAALFGYSLDPHPRLQVTGEVDWRVLDGGFDGVGGEGGGTNTGGAGMGYAVA
ncbi:Nitrogen assimilation transcription factor nirA [Cyphellophora attinorum]|uniref:Nitrogen assimilation transcription factor nirA n=1 Tax=Cyphellophora attinorum TaxID=1664694 RepID=A0A0N1NYM6_9EURO|nr:Nitrogen assimilation transcription factor nirA [Phialophora attinorum]KPI40425.1 Nitrogen assimilation transcription factor nirA [Phialophora attinorum]